MGLEDVFRVVWCKFIVVYLGANTFQHLATPTLLKQLSDVSTTCNQLVMQSMWNMTPTFGRLWCKTFSRVHFKHILTLAIRCTSLNDAFVTTEKVDYMVKAMCESLIDHKADGLRFEENVLPELEEHKYVFEDLTVLQHCFEIINVVHVLYHILRSVSKSEPEKGYGQLRQLRQLAGLCYDCSRSVQIRTTKNVEEMETYAFRYTWIAWYNIPFVIQCSVLCLCEEAFDFLRANFLREQTVSVINLASKNIAIPKIWKEFKTSIYSIMKNAYENMTKERKASSLINNDKVFELLWDAIQALGVVSQF